MNVLDEQEYERGHQAFMNGVELKDVIKRVIGEPDESKAMSHVFGFLGGALHRLRAS